MAGQFLDVKELDPLNLLTEITPLLLRPERILIVSNHTGGDFRYVHRRL